MQDISFIDTPSHLTPLRRELLNWFRQKASSLAPAYKGAIWLIGAGDFPARIHFIAHAIRDISDRLVFALDEQLESSRVQYENEMDKIEKLWPRLTSIQDTEEVITKLEPVTIGQEVAVIIDSLVTKHRERREGPSNYELLFRFLMRKEPLQVEANQRLVTEFKKMKDWFMPFAHLSHKEIPQFDESELQIQFKKFENMLHSFVGNYFTGEKELNEILRQANMKPYKEPNSSQVDSAIPLMSSPRHEAYFFEQLENPRWIMPLQNRGKGDMFNHPPKVESIEGGGLRFPVWPASKYLVRMAIYAPSEVASIYSRLDTKNISIIKDMIHAALKMPPKIAATLVSKIRRAITKEILLVHFSDAGDLCVHLAEGGEVIAAMKLTKILFTPKFKEGQEQLIRPDEYWYKEGLKKVMPALIEQEPRKFLSMLCEWLKLSVDAKRRVDLNTGSDYSYIWRPAIEEHGQNRDYDFAGAMVGFVRQGFEQAIQDRKLFLKEAFEIIDRHSYLVFKRLKIHLINQFADQDTELARQSVMRRDLFDDHEYKYEYAMLVGKRFDLLTAEERDTWFKWIDSGPDLSNFDKAIKSRLGRDATEEDRKNRKHYWQFEKLHCVREHLEGKWKEFYENMLAQHGEPELADLNSRIGSTWMRNVSPMTGEDLAKLTFEQAVEKISSWKPSEQKLMAPNIEGLASTFEQYVANKPEKFSSQVDILIGRPAIFVRGFIKQMAEAIKAAGDIDVHAVLKLCLWVVKRPLEERTTPEHGDDALVDVDKDWQWTRDNISQLIQNICRATLDRMPRYPLDGLREQIWQLASALSHDRAESYIIHDLSKDDPRTRDYLDLSINSPRGKAVEAALDYAHWVANHIKKVANKQEMVLGGFDAMPEVREMLEWQIAPENCSVAASAMIGSRLRLIYWIDKNWLAANTERLFYLKGIEESPPMSHGWAAWNAFLVCVRPHIEFYKLFRKQFVYAVAESSQIDLAEDTREQPMHHLGEHLVILYGRGQLGLDEDGGLLKRFLTESKPDIRRFAIDFAGRSLEGEEKISQEIVERFMVLWEMYWAETGKQDVQQKPDAWSFGIWFASGKFPEQWALDQLEDFINVTPIPEPDHSVVEQLAKIAQVDLLKAVHILDRMVRGDREGWRIPGWIDSAKQILKMAMQAGGDARIKAERLIDYLGRRGHTDFGSLLNKDLD